MSSDDTIFALASGVGRAAVAVLRISGPRTRMIIEKMAGGLPEPRQARLVTFRDPASGEALDRGLMLWFPGPRSFSGEDYAEFQVHGGQAVTAALLRALATFADVRAAEAGEFTRRAFENGKMDLAEVEGLADLIDAETERQRQQALRQMSGSLSAQTAAWRAALLEAAALIEAEIDFSDEADVPRLPIARIKALLYPVVSGLRAELDAGRAGERLREGLVVVIAGPPNAGKSTLLNALTRREAAIVSPLAGTTRDTIEIHLDIDGFPVTLIDTAGLRDSVDLVEQIGVARALRKAESADLVLWLSEANAPTPPAAELTGRQIWPVFTKLDLGAPLAKDADGLYLSATTGENLKVLIERIAAFAHRLAGDGRVGLITRERHRRAFTIAVSALQRIEGNLTGPIELAAEDLRIAVRALETILGKVGVEDVLGEIFGRFCIGK